MTGWTSASLIGCAQLTDHNPSMLLPLFKFSGDECLYAQLYDPLGAVQGFHVVTETPWWLAQEDQVITIENGDEPVISFTNSAGHIHCGKRSELLSTLRTVCGSREASDAFKLSAYELIGDREKIMHHRSKTIEDISKEIGVASAAAYRNSVAGDLAWRLLEKNVAHLDAAEKLSLFRATITTRFSGDVLEIDLGSMSPEDFSISVDEIVRRVSNEMRGAASVIQSPSKADLSEVGGTDPAYKDLLQAVDSSGRQEERIAILIRSILLSPRQGFHLLEHYHHQAKFETEAVNIIRNAMGRWELLDDDRMEMRLARIIRPLITASYPMRKGETIFFFAEHLSDFDLIRAEIERALRESQSLSVNLLRKQIELALDRRNARLV